MGPGSNWGLDDFLGRIFFLHRLGGKVDRLICYLLFITAVHRPVSTLSIAARTIARL